MSNTHYNICNAEAVNALLDRYWEGASTEADEQWLRSLLTGEDAEGLDIPLDAATAERLAEALAVMSASMAMPERPRRAKAWTPRRWVAAAASVAVVVFSASWLLIGTAPTAHADQCIAYVNGQVVDDPSKVLEMMRGDLNSIGAGSKSAEALPAMQLDELRQALDDINK